VGHSRTRGLRPEAQGRMTVDPSGADLDLAARIGARCALSQRFSEDSPSVPVARRLIAHHLR
jgi:hypothetical protein